MQGIGTQIPIAICIDVEPDMRDVPYGAEGRWRGQEETFKFFQNLRPRLASATGTSAHYAWFLRMDPQIAESYGSSDYFTATYPDQVESFTKNGDEIGLHTHGWHRDATNRKWIVDHGNQYWVNRCIRTSFEAYEAVFQKKCRSFRFGDRWMNGPTLELLERLGVRYELTLEPGHSKRPKEWQRETVTGRFSNYRRVPLLPYRPSKKDFRKPDAARREGLWMIPVSTQKFRTPRGKDEGFSKIFHRFLPRPEQTRTLRLGIPAGAFKSGVEILLNSLEKPFLVLAVRSCVSLSTRRMEFMKQGLDYLLTHPQVSRFTFTTPSGLLGELGYLT